MTNRAKTWTLAMMLACRAPESHVDHSASAKPSASVTVSVSASASVAVSAPPPAGPTKTCGQTGAVLTGEAVVGLVASPASIQVGRTNGKRVLVLSDPKWAECDIVVEETASIPGPFSGASGSDAKWRAAFYSSTENVYVVVLDAANTVRGLAAVPSTPFGNQGHMESRDVFADGHTIFYSGTVSADGWEQLEAHLFGFADGKLAALFTYDTSIGMGSIERWDVTTSAVGATPPTVTVDLSTRESVVSKAGGGFRTLKPEKRHTVERWNGHTFR